MPNPPSKLYLIYYSKHWRGLQEFTENFSVAEKFPLGPGDTAIASWRAACDKRKPCHGDRKNAEKRHYSGKARRFPLLAGKRTNKKKEKYFTDIKRQRRKLLCGFLECLRLPSESPSMRGMSRSDRGSWKKRKFDFHVFFPSRLTSPPFCVKISM